MIAMDWLDAELTSVAFCWRIERRDGVTIGLTSHDSDLATSEVVYRAKPGMVPSAIERRDPIKGGGMEISGALSSDAVTKRDLLEGRWDGAAVTVFAVDWRSPDDIQLLGSGRIGSVTLSNGGFAAEFHGAAVVFDRQASERTTPDCRARLGDARCRVPMAPRRRYARILSQDGRRLTLDVHEPVANAYGDGRLRWVTGANSGLEALIARSEGAELYLRRFPHHVDPGAMVEIEQGCDRQIETCAARFGNALNFQGEPFLPGMDLLTRYPGA